MRQKTQLIDVPEKTIGLMVLMGHVRLAEDGIHELTPEGETWLKNWCDEKIAEHESRT